MRNLLLLSFFSLACHLTSCVTVQNVPYQLNYLSITPEVSQREVPNVLSDVAVSTRVYDNICTITVTNNGNTPRMINWTSSYFEFEGTQVALNEGFVSENSNKIASTTAEFQVDNHTLIRIESENNFTDICSPGQSIQKEVNINLIYKNAPVTWIQDQTHKMYINVSDIEETQDTWKTYVAIPYLSSHNASNPYQSNIILYQEEERVNARLTVASFFGFGAIILLTIIGGDSEDGSGDEE